ncbi:Hexb [Symbiodinium sp. CCMP2592]|nr:Hexb [Symbiodinium sp. CCMP2592]
MAARWQISQPKVFDVCWLASSVVKAAAGTFRAGRSLKSARGARSAQPRAAAALASWQQFGFRALWVCRARKDREQVCVLSRNTLSRSWAVRPPSRSKRAPVSSDGQLREVQRPASPLRSGAPFDCERSLRGPDFSTGQCVRAITGQKTLDLGPSSYDLRDQLSGRVWPLVRRRVHLELQDLAAPLELGVNESYELAVSMQGLSIPGHCVFQDVQGFGFALYCTLSAHKSGWSLRDFGLEGEYNFTTDTYAIHEIPFRIQDSPSFPHRGLLVDSARHFLPPIRLKRTIEAMSFAKLNVLHWHLTEDESFSMPSSSHPELAEKGAWSADERYSLRDVQDVVEFAQLHGVRVIPEFDMPGHVSSWSKSHPELFDQACLERSRRLAFKPTKEVFDFLQGLLSEWTTSTFHDQFLHLGSDEVPFECWKGLSISEGGKTYSTPKQLFQHFVGSMFSRAHGELNRSVIFWDEAWKWERLSCARVQEPFRLSSLLKPRPVWQNSHILRH